MPKIPSYPFVAEPVRNLGIGRRGLISPGVECVPFSATLAEINAALALTPGIAGFKYLPLDFMLRVTGNFGAATDLRLSSRASSPIDIVTVPLASLRDGAIIRPGGAGGTISPMRSVSQEVLFDEMTDGGGAAGTLAFESTIPAGARISHWDAVVSEGFIGDVSAVVKVGVSGDDDRFSADTAQSVFAAGRVGSAPLAADVLDGLGAAVTPLVTVTSGSDFGSVSAGAMVVTVYYYDPAQEDETAAQLGAGFLAVGAEGVGIQIRKTGSTATGGTSVSGWLAYQLIPRN